MAAVPDAESFVQGDAGAVAQVRGVVEGVVRGFRLFASGWGPDLVQEAMGRIYLGLAGGRFRHESSLTTYARSVARFTCMEHLRRRRAHLGTDFRGTASPARWAAPESSLLDDEEHQRNLRAFGSLPQECRELLVMAFVERRSYREVAGTLGISVSALKSRVHRCRQRIVAAIRSESKRFRMRTPSSTRRARPGNSDEREL